MSSLHEHLQGVLNFLLWGRKEVEVSPPPLAPSAASPAPPPAPLAPPAHPNAHPPFVPASLYSQLISWLDKSIKFTFTQEAGDLIYIPPGWAHSFKTIGGEAFPIAALGGETLVGVAISHVMFYNDMRSCARLLFLNNIFFL